MDPANILRIITNSTWMVTRLVSGGPVQFSQDVYHTEVQENSSPGPILQLSVSVSSKSDPVRFKVKKGDPTNLFRMENETGKLILLQPLDFEQAKQHELLVEAESGSARSEARVVVSVGDENDHSPSFQRQKYETQITEEDDRHLPKKILTVSAEDGDAGEFGRLLYSLSGDGTSSQTQDPFFSIDRESGALYVLKPLDRDPPNGRAKWVLHVTATDGTIDATTTITVNVKDVNDNVPYFDDDKVHASIMENGQEGLEVITMTAHDDDDVNEGSNAKLTYSLEKNVIDERSGRPLFTVDGRSGKVTTSVCCLDREKTPHYAIQVVATDGGGMKGTGTVMVEVADENDVAPSFSEREWTFSIDEEFQDDKIVASLSVVDKDDTNDFAFRIVPGSGPGWQLFKIEADGNEPTAYLRTKSLDFENPDHRKGFRFYVQVTDKGEKGWKEKERIDSSWVNINVKDINDNAPTFTHARIYFPRPEDSSNANYVRISLPEDAPQNTVLASFKAYDADEEGKASVKFQIGSTSDMAHHFAVDDVGIVRLSLSLDRETMNRHTVFVVASDLGNPSLSSTATLIVDVEDVNDNPPFLQPSPTLKIVEGTSPRVVGKFYLGDPDDWGLGHGPPFVVNMDPKAPESIKMAVAVNFYPDRGPDRVGEGTIQTKVSLDRERNRQLFVPLFVSDSGRPPMTATRTLTILVEDINDNKMKPGEKTVFVLRTQSSSSAVPLGRVYVRDLDDWDAAEKTYAWKKAQPLFRLDPAKGSVEMLPGGKEGRYALHFLVSDARHQQKNISAKVFVEVHLVSRELLRSSLPILIDTPPHQLIMDQKKTSLLERFENLLGKWLEDLLRHSPNDSAGVLRFKQNMEDLKTKRRVFQEDFFKDSLIHVVSMIPWGDAEMQTRLYIIAQDLFSLHHLVLFYRQSMFDELGINILEIGDEIHCRNGTLRSSCMEKCDLIRDKEFWIIDANVTSRVGPRMFDKKEGPCACADTLSTNDDHLRDSTSLQDLCYPNPCLNGGRCLPIQEGFKCICPEETQGRLCKIVMRSFEGSVFDGGGTAYPLGGETPSNSDAKHSWAWVAAPNLCLEGHFSLQFLTTQSDGLLLNWDSHSLPSKVTIQSSQGRRNRGKRSLQQKSKTRRTRLEGTITENENSGRTGNFRVTDVQESTKHLSVSSRVLSPQGIKDPQWNTNTLNISTNKENNLLNTFGMGVAPLKNKLSPEIHERIVNANVTTERWRKRFKRQLLQRLPKKLPDMLKVELRDGRPVTTMQIQGEQVVLLLDAESLQVADNSWHRIDVRWRDKTVEMVLDLCLGESTQLYENFHHSEQISPKIPSKETLSKPLDPHPSAQPPSFHQRNISASPLLSSKSARPLNPRPKVTSRSPEKEFKIHSSISSMPHGISSSASSSMSFDKARLTFPNPPAEKLCRVRRTLTKTIKAFQPSSPISLGGLRTKVIQGGNERRQSESQNQKSLKGCIKNFRINDVLQDLGYGLIAQRSLPGCPNVNCKGLKNGCGTNGKCLGSPAKEYCSCQPGWTGLSCRLPTKPLSFHPHSYVSLASKVPPFPYTTILQMRFRTRELSGTLVQLYGIGGQLHMSVDLKEGHLCLLLHWPQHKEINLCLERVFLNDGIWHSLKASRRGVGGFISVDDEDADHYNSSLDLEKGKAIHIDTNEAVWIGGVPQQIQNDDVFIVKSDFRRGCVDDLRLQGKPLPLPPTLNSTKWGQVRTVHEISEGCSPSLSCPKVSCRPPLTCYDTWRSYNCRCEDGRVLSERNSCDYVDECIWAPCLHGAACLNTNAGYSCSCPDGYTGRHCQFIENETSSFSLSVGAMVATIAWCFILLLLCALLIHHQHRRSGNNKGRSRSDGKENEMPHRDQSSPSTRSSLTPNLLQLKMIPTPNLNGQPSWNKNPNIAHVDVLQVEPIQTTEMTNTISVNVANSMNDVLENHISSPAKIRLNGGVSSTCSSGRKGERNKPFGEQNGGPPLVIDQSSVSEDLRNYAYEGEGSSPGSLSSYVDVLQVEPIQTTEMTNTISVNVANSMNDVLENHISSPAKIRLNGGVSSTCSSGRKGERNKPFGEQNGGPPLVIDQSSVSEDLRNYAYEGEGSSPGSLSSYVDVLQVEPIQTTEMTNTISVNVANSMNDVLENHISSPAKIRLNGGVSSTCSSGRKGERNKPFGEQNGGPPLVIDQSSVSEDLRNYAYEGEGSSPGSLSSCLESCSGSFKFMGGFRDVAQLLESCDFQSSSNSNPSTAEDNLTEAYNSTSVEGSQMRVRMIKVAPEQAIVTSRLNEVTSGDSTLNPPLPSHPSNDIQSSSTKEPSSCRNNIFCTSGANLIPEAPEGFRNS